MPRGFGAGNPRVRCGTGCFGGCPADLVRGIRRLAAGSRVAPPFLHDQNVLTLEFHQVKIYVPLDSRHAAVGHLLRRDTRRDRVARKGHGPRRQGRHAADGNARRHSRRVRGSARAVRSGGRQATRSLKRDFNRGARGDLREQYGSLRALRTVRFAFFVLKGTAAAARVSSWPERRRRRAR